MTEAEQVEALAGALAECGAVIKVLRKRISALEAQGPIYVDARTEPPHDRPGSRGNAPTGTEGEVPRTAEDELWEASGALVKAGVSEGSLTAGIERLARDATIARSTRGALERQLDAIRAAAPEDDHDAALLRIQALQGEANALRAEMAAMKGGVPEPALHRDLHGAVVGRTYGLRVGLTLQGMSRAMAERVAGEVTAELEEWLRGILAGRAAREGWGPDHRGWEMSVALGRPPEAGDA